MGYGYANPIKKLEFSNNKIIRESSAIFRLMNKLVSIHWLGQILNKSVVIVDVLVQQLQRQQQPQQLSHRNGAGGDNGKGMVKIRLIF